MNGGEEGGDRKFKVDKQHLAKKHIDNEEMVKAH